MEFEHFNRLDCFIQVDNFIYLNPYDWLDHFIS